jgi:hypothetical protein
MPNTATVSPVPIPAVVQIQRMGYDVAFNHNLAPYQPQPMYAQTGAPYPHDVYQAAPPNIVLANNDQFYPQQTDYAANAGHQSNQEKRSNWDNVIPKNPNVLQQTKRASTKSLAELHQRKQEVLSQLEKVVGKNVATAISHNATSLARQESQHDLDSPTSPYTFWTGHTNSGPTFVRSDSILAADDDYVPYDSPAISKYGPISRMHKDNGQVSSFRDGSMSSPLVSTTKDTQKDSEGTLEGLSLQLSISILDAQTSLVGQSGDVFVLQQQSAPVPSRVDTPRPRHRGPPRQQHR